MKLIQHKICFKEEMGRGVVLFFQQASNIIKTSAKAYNLFHFYFSLTDDFQNFFSSVIQNTGPKETLKFQEKFFYYT